MAIAFVFYLAIRFTQSVLGFSSALIHLARPRLGFSVYWTLRVLEHSLAFRFFDIEQWLVYLLGLAIGAAYYPFYADGSERTGARASRWFRRMRVWRLIHWWTDFEIGDGSTIEVAERTLFAVHPHGFVPVSVALAFAIVGKGGPIVRLAKGATDSVWRCAPSPDPLIATTFIVFWIPFLREIFLWAGCIVADEEVMIEALKTRSLVVMPGGIGESTLYDHNKLRISFEHSGFLRVAEAAGVSVQPMFAQGENRAWVVLPGWRAFRRFVSRRIWYAFPTPFVPFLFPHELRLRYSKDRLMIRPRNTPEVKASFSSCVLELVTRYEDPEDIDLTELGEQ